MLADQLDEALHDLNTAVKLKPEFSVAQVRPVKVYIFHLVYPLNYGSFSCMYYEHFYPGSLLVAAYSDSFLYMLAT